MNADGGRPSAGSGSTRRSIRTRACCCTRQPDDVWRIDFQLGWDADPEDEKQPENIIPRVRALLAHRRDEGRRVRARMGQRLHLRLPAHGRASATAACCSPATRRTACRRSARAAPTRACRMPRTWPGSWPRCCSGEAPDALLDSYADEREYAADENIRNSTRATDFITPKSEVSRLFRDAVLELAQAPAVRAHAGQQRPAVGAGDAARLGAEHAGRRCLRRRDGARRAGRRCAARRARRPRRLAAARDSARRLHAAGLRRGAAAGRSRGCRASTCSLIDARRPCSDRAKASPRSATTAARHRLPAAPRPARLRALARARPPRPCARRCGARRAEH